MTTQPPPNLLHGSLELVLSARRRQVAPSPEARAQHLAELEAKAAMLYALGLTGGLQGPELVHLVLLSSPIGAVPEPGGQGLTGYLNEWAANVAWMMRWDHDPDQERAALLPVRSTL